MSTARQARREKLLAARMQSLRLVDLPRLAAHRRRAAEAEEEADGEPVDATPSPRVAGIDVSELDA